MEEMYLDNEKLVWYVLKRWFGECVGDEDAQQEARIGLWRACKEFDKDRGLKFSTYAVKAIYNSVLLWFRKRRKDIPAEMMVSIDEKIVGELTVADTIVGDKDVELDDLRLVFPKISERDETILRMRMDGDSWEKIGKEVGLSGVWAKKRVEMLREKYIRYNT